MKYCSLAPAGVYDATSSLPAHLNHFAFLYKERNAAPTAAQRDHAGIRFRILLHLILVGTAPRPLQAEQADPSKALTSLTSCLRGKGRREYIPPETGLREEEIGDSPDLEAEATRAAEMAGQSPVREWRFRHVQTRN